MHERYNNIIELKEISSTNDYAMELARTESVPDFTTICTDFQSKGRGQLGNFWESNRGENLLFSVIVHPREIALKEQFILSQCVALSVRDIVALFCENVTVKWPNDIYVGNNKVAGILIENQLSQKHIEFSVIGIGLNVNQTTFTSAPNPTSLSLENDKLHFDKEEVLQLFLNRLTENYNLICSNPKQIRTRYLDFLYLKNVPHIYSDADGFFEGKITNVEADGRLVITDTYGNEKKYYFKEVQYILM
ncbi:MAG: biotin--[acetyl-CoA-carboxylase] ligase [Bacteroidales bacterium]|nr:biotin--[acetyl-CoA-carboxylase] ligase [Bacteroidales bacterium]